MLMQASCQLACWHKEAECTQESAYAAQACCNVDARHQEAECSQDSGSCSTGLLGTGVSHWLSVLLMHYLLIRPLPATLAVSIAGGQAQLPGRPTHPIAPAIVTIYNYREDSAACCTGTAFAFSCFATCTPSSFPSPPLPPPPPPKDGASAACSQTSGKLEALASRAVRGLPVAGLEGLSDLGVKRSSRSWRLTRRPPSAPAARLSVENNQCLRQQSTPKLLH